MRPLLRLGPYAILVAVAAGLALTWDRLPARYPIHWGVHGADRWTNLSLRSVGLPLLMGVVSVAWMGALRRFLLANAPPAPDPGRVRRLVTALTVAEQWHLGLLFGLVAVPRQDPGLVLAGAGLGFLALPAALVFAFAGKAPPPVAPAPAPPGGWLLEPRRGGTGWSVRWGHPRARRMILLLAAYPVAIIALAAAM